MVIGRANFTDFQFAHSLYCELTSGKKEAAPSNDPKLREAVLSHSGTQVICAKKAGELIAMLTLHILPNITYVGTP